MSHVAAGIRVLEHHLRSLESSQSDREDDVADLQRRLAWAITSRDGATASIADIKQTIATLRATEENE